MQYSHAPLFIQFYFSYLASLHQFLHAIGNPIAYQGPPSSHHILYFAVSDSLPLSISQSFSLSIHPSLILSLSLSLLLSLSHSLSLSSMCVCIILLFYFLFQAITYCTELCNTKCTVHLFPLLIIRSSTSFTWDSAFARWHRLTASSVSFSFHEYIDF